ncbi:MAG TPA: tetratricopeptide repeat protein [Parvularculaceae bacterium]|nr:tetratricopeptide repeat protein [Parvularculaceae bacterium]
MRLWMLTAAVLIPLTSGCSVFQGRGHIDITPVQKAVGQPPETAADLLKQERYTEASAAFRTALAQNPNDLDARYGLAESLRLGGDPEASKAEYLKVAASPDWRAKALEGEGSADLVTGDQDGAYESFNAAVELDPNSWRAWLGLARLRDLAHDWANADEAYAAAMKTSDQKAVVLNNEGVSHLARLDTPGAIDLFQQALAADPALDRARTNLELARATSDASVDGIAASEPDAKKRAQKLNNYGYVAMLQGRLDEAERAFESAIEAYPSFYPTAYQNLQAVKAMRANAVRK